MGVISRELIDNWGQGVINSAEGDAVPEAAYIKGRNAALTSIGVGKAAVKKRDGFGCLNATAITGSSAIIGIYEFRRRVAAAFTQYHLAVSDSGRFDMFDPDSGALTNIGATTFTASTTQEYLPSFTTGNNLCFIVNGIDAKKYDGTTVYRIGIVEPSTAPTLADSGIAGSPNGTYEARVTFYNSATGQESSAGATSSTVTVASKKISFTAIPISTDPQVDQRKLYIRNTGTQSNFYLATTITDNTSTTYTYNGTDAALVDIGPDTAENDPPVAGVKFACFHKSRLFLADTTNVYYSKLDMAESFDPDNYETPNPSDGQGITGLVSIFDLLIIFKTNSVYVLVGDDPDTWAIRPIDNTIGCATSRSIILTEGRLYWWSEQGPVIWAGGIEKPELLAPPYISETVSPTNLSLDSTYLAKIAGSYDVVNERILWAVPQYAQTRNTLLLPFNTRVGRWESDGWDPMDVATLSTIDGADGQPFIIVGGYGGQLFRFGSSSSDGIASSTTYTGTFVASGVTVTTVTDLTATFDTTGAGLIERKVTICDSTGVPVDEAAIRPRITSNTATAFTLSTTVGNLTSGATYTYYIGGPAFDLQTKWLVHGDAFLKKRYMFLNTQVNTGGSIDDVLVNVYFSYDINEATTTSFSFTADYLGSNWDDVDWDDFTWSGTSELQTRHRIGRTGTSCMVRFRHYVPNAELLILKVAVAAEGLSDRLG